MADLLYWLWLTTRKGLGPEGALTMLDCFSTPERVYYSDLEDYEFMALSEQARQSLMDKSLDKPNKILGDCDRLGLRVMTFQDSDYPQRLRQIGVPPLVLYIKGKTIRFDDEISIGIVGARRSAEVSCRRAEKFGLELTSKGGMVVSGIAQGVDSWAVRGALKAGGPVVSVLAGGADMRYPAENRFLYDDVAAAGALVSEYPPGTLHRGSHFNPRNRILSGLCLGVLAVECEPRSGTMLTVNHALEQGREVYAVPIGLDEQCARETNRLISARKARLVENADDILRDFVDLYPARLSKVEPLTPKAVQARLSRLAQMRDKPGKADVPKRERVPRDQQKSRFTDDELALLAAAAKSALSVDELVVKTGIPAKRVMSALTMLQVAGVMEEQPGRRFYALVELEP